MSIKFFGMVTIVAVMAADQTANVVPPSLSAKEVGYVVTFFIHRKVTANTVDHNNNNNIGPSLTREGYRSLPFMQRR